MGFIAKFVPFAVAALTLVGCGSASSVADQPVSPEQSEQSTNATVDIGALDLTSVLPTVAEVKAVLGENWDVGIPSSEVISTYSPPVKAAKEPATCDSIKAEGGAGGSDYGVQKAGGVNATSEDRSNGSWSRLSVIAYSDESTPAKVLKFEQSRPQTLCGAKWKEDQVVAVPSTISGAYSHRSTLSDGSIQACTFTIRASLYIQACLNRPAGEIDTDALTRIVLDKLSAAEIP